MRAVIKQLHAKKHRLVIASTIRSDIIKHALKTLALEEYFEKVYANTPDLRYSKRDVVQMANKNLGKSDYMIGDKEEDILSGQAVKAKAIYVTWGATGTDFTGRADFTIEKPSEILNIIK
jgi:phosphoglycolate phosphatase-like HAD superfamily hydrolase